MLARFEVDYVLVGGLAAVVQGAPVSTFDVDIVYARTPENIERLLAALTDLGATFRGDSRAIAPNASDLVSAWHKLLVTRLGPLDALGTIEEATGYEDLLGDSEWLEIESTKVRVLTLERLITVKEQLTRPKDKLMLLQLRATLDERRKAR